MGDTHGVVCFLSCVQVVSRGFLLRCRCRFGRRRSGRIIGGGAICGGIFRFCIDVSSEAKGTFVHGLVVIARCLGRCRLFNNLLNAWLYGL